MVLRRAALAVLFSMFIGGIAQAQDRPLPEVLLQFLGQEVDLRANPELATQLASRGIIERSRSKVKVDAAFIERVLGNERYLEFSNARYHPGDRVYVQENGKTHYRAEIVSINDDGSYKVKVWDKLKSLETPSSGKPVDPITGKVTDARNAPLTRVEVPQPDGSVKIESLLEPWNERPNLREITVPHAELDRLNGKVDPKGAYRVNGYLVDSEKDVVLRKAIEVANRHVDQLIKDGKLDLTLPSDPAAAKAKIEQIAAIQREVIVHLFKTNEMSYTDHGKGGYWDQQYDEMKKDQTFMVNGERLVGAVLKWGVGICTDQTAALNSIFREVGRRLGFDVRVVNGMYTGGYHNFEDVHTVDGKNFINDPSWHSQSSTPWAALENIDFATYDTRPWANRAFATFNEAVSEPTKFRDNAARSRDAGDVFLEKMLAADAQKRVAAGATPDAAVKAAIEANRAVLGDTNRLYASVVAQVSRTPGVAGALGNNDRLADRTRVANDHLLDRTRAATSLDRTRAR